MALAVLLAYGKAWLAEGHIGGVLYLSYRNFATSVLLTALPMPFFLCLRHRGHLATAAVLALALALTGSRSALLFGGILLTLCCVYLMRSGVISRRCLVLLAALKPQEVLELLDHCGDEVLMEHPTALLVLMRRMFTWGQIPRMRQLKDLLLESVRRHPELTDRQLEALCRQVREFTLPITGTCGFDQAQVTAGGLRTGEFDPRTMESRLTPGFYACGEVLDIDGDCGGFNLQWAWASGRLAGRLLHV